MDPASIVGLTVATQQLLKCIYDVYSFGQSVYDAKEEINQLCSELLALRSALEHIRLNSDFTRRARSEIKKDAQLTVFSSSNFATPEFQEMVSSTEIILKELQARLELKPNRLKSSFQRLTWPLRGDVRRYVDQLERAKSWFVLATTSDNMYGSIKSLFWISATDTRREVCSVESLTEGFFPLTSGYNVRRVSKNSGILVFQVTALIHRY